MSHDELVISDVRAFEFLDSRGNPTVAVEVQTKGGGKGLAIVPSGASKGKKEAVELRDGDPKRFFGKGVKKAVENVNTTIRKAILGMRADKQREIDELLISLDGTKNKSNLGANAILGVSIACAKAAANTLKIEVFEYIGGTFGSTLPVPLCNVINGGEHAGWNVDFQEYMIVPAGFSSFHDAIRCASEIFQTIKKILSEQGIIPAVGDEGGFAPPLKDNESALETLIFATEKAGYTPADNVFFALDLAASSFYNEKEKLYILKKEGKKMNTDELSEKIIRICEKYPIISVEDPLAEDDWDGWKKLTQYLTQKGIQVVGDDIFVTNPEIFEKGIKEKIANAILVKVNQIGTLTETFEVLNMAKRTGYSTVISHRSGDTEDTFISDLAVGVNAGQIKTGSLSRSERVAKYNRLIYIEGTGKAKFIGKKAFPLKHL
jgi:enolase